MITERRIPELIPVFSSQPAGDVNYIPDGKLPLLSARPAVTPATLNRAATSGAAGTLAARGGGQICRPFVLGFGNWRACLKYKSHVM